MTPLSPALYLSRKKFSKSVVICQQMRGQWDCLRALCPNSSADILLYVKEVLCLLTCVPKVGLVSYLSGITLEYYQESAGPPVIWPDATGLDYAIPTGFGQTLMTAEVRESTGTSLMALRQLCCCLWHIFMCKCTERPEPHNSLSTQPSHYLILEVWAQNSFPVNCTWLPIHPLGDHEVRVSQYFLHLKSLGIQESAAKGNGK